jgi:hypothetical protein
MSIKYGFIGELQTFETTLQKQSLEVESNDILFKYQ